MSIQARVETGSGHQLLLAAASVADPRWRLVFTGAAGLAASWQRELGRGFVAELASLGRFGWINLAGLAVQHGAGAGRADLLAMVESLPPVQLHAVLMGADRRQLAEVLGADTRQLVADAAGGSAAARTVVRRALAAGRTNLEVHRWLWRAGSDDVRDRCRALLTALPDQGAGPDPAPMRALVAEHGFEAALARVAPRLHYTAGSLDRVVLVASAAVDPVIVEIDLPELTVIVHPPLATASEADPLARLRRLARAAGDDVRLQILAALRASPRTLPELVAGLDRPRTTLLHHLAMLRGAGLIDVVVPAHGPNSYRLDEAGFEELATAAREFVGRGVTTPG